MKHNRNIDNFRALALLQILVYHAWVMGGSPNLHNGSNSDRSYFCRVLRLKSTFFLVKLQKGRLNKTSRCYQLANMWLCTSDLDKGENSNEQKSIEYRSGCVAINDFIPMHRTNRNLLRKHKGFLFCVR